MSRPLFILEGSKPVCSGAGLIALDVVFGADPQVPPKVWAGGSCGNVLTILAYLGWDSYPVARLRDDRFARKLVDDLARWHVDTSLIYTENAGSTPIIIERITTDRDNAPRHRFEFTCPNCRSWLPRFRPVPAKHVDRIAGGIPRSAVFYLDRATPGALALARRSREDGALIVFEPSSMNDARLFHQCLEITDVLKYSNDRLGSIGNVAQGTSIPLQVETFGSVGLRYRRSRPGCVSGQWVHMKPFSVRGIRDAAGSGDWCTAGLIHWLGAGTLVGLHDVPDSDVEEALRFGQALAALNCLYEGARGAMYGLSRTQFSERLRDMLRGVCVAEHASEATLAEPVVGVTDRLCPSCDSGS